MAGSWSNTLTTSLTLPTGAADPTPRIVEDGISDTILIYGPGGALIASVAATAGTDGLGNTYPAGISASAGVISDSIFLLYDGVPAAGNLVTSIANAAGTDSFGNAYLNGVMTYRILAPFGAVSFVQMVDDNILIGGVSAGVFNTAGAASFGSANGNHAFVFSGLSSDATKTIQSGLEFFSGAAAAVTGSAKVPHIDAVDNAGSSAVDFRVSGNAFKADVSGTVLQVQKPTPPTGWGFNGFSNEYGIQYWFDNDDNLVISGAAQYTGAVTIAAGSSTTLFTLPVNYRPPKGSRRLAYQSSGTGTFAWVAVQNTGAVIVGNPTAIATSAVIEFEVTIPMGNRP